MLRTGHGQTAHSSAQQAVAAGATRCRTGRQPSAWSHRPPRHRYQLWRNDRSARRGSDGTPPQRHELISARIAVREPGDRFLEGHGRDPSLHRPDSLKPPPVRGQRRSLQTSRWPLDVAKPGRPVAPGDNPTRGPCSGQLPPRRERLGSRQASHASSPHSQPSGGLVGLPYGVFDRTERRRVTHRSAVGTEPDLACTKGSRFQCRYRLTTVSESLRGITRNREYFTTEFPLASLRAGTSPLLDIHEKAA